MKWLDGITDSMDMSMRKLWEMVNGIIDSVDVGLSNFREIQDSEAWRAAVHGVSKSWTQLSD